MNAVQAERRVLDLLRPQYEAEGFTFVENPGAADLPGFMLGYQPDALALGRDKSIAIAVKMRGQSEADKNLSSISARFKNHPNWEFRVVYGADIENETIDAPTLDQIRMHVDEAEQLLRLDHLRAALLIAWAAIEATARTLSPVKLATGPLTTRQTLELLEHHGRLPFDQAKTLREQLPLRNKVAHGDFQAQVTRENVEAVVCAARAALEDQ